MRSKQTMTSGQWLVAFASVIVMLALLVMGFNYATDPFCAFGDPFFQWWSYGETLNPRVAKISYLEKNHDKYDSYIIGSSSSSSFPTEQLNEYFDARFYNLIMYGSDMHDVELTSRYVIEHYNVKNLVVSLYINNAEIYDIEPDRLTYNLHSKVDGTSALSFYGRYLLANPRYGWEKIRNFINDTYQQKSYDVFNEETGAYDKSKRDVEAISSLERYYAKEMYAPFLNYPSGSGITPYLDECMSALRSIKELCQEQGVTFTVVCPPMYYEYMNYYSSESIEAFNRALADVTDYWDFTLSSVSFEPRYFYDTTHFRNCVGKMALARIFKDESVYIPSDFGHYVTAVTVDELMDTYQSAQSMPQETYTTQLPILMYHHLEEGKGDDNAIDPERFAEHMAALRDSGYTAVTFDDLRAYVETGTELPENPVLITFDDGYESNLTLAAPILREYGMRGTVFVIGVSIGKDTYKDTGSAMTPHFMLQDAIDHMDVLDVESHGFNIHEVEGRDPSPVRKGVLQRDDESESEYIQFLRNDCETMNRLFQDAYGVNVGVLSYPYGHYSELSEQILHEYGIYATVTSDAHLNTLIKGMPQSLLQMGRFTINGEMTAEALIAMLENAE